MTQDEFDKLKIGDAVIEDCTGTTYLVGFVTEAPESRLIRLNHTQSLRKVLVSPTDAGLFNLLYPEVQA